jgi:hypothetical protein
MRYGTESRLSMTSEEFEARAALIAAMQPKTFEERYAELLLAASAEENKRARARWGMIPTKTQMKAWNMGDPTQRVNKTGRRLGSKYT